MKPILLFAVCLLFIFSSCKKSGGGDGSTPANSISATVDGVNLNFSTYAAAKRDSDIVGLLNFSGETAESGNRELIQLLVETNNLNSPIMNGTYVSTGYASNAGVAYIHYVDITANAQNNETYVNFNTNNLNSNNTTTITITSISSTNVQGTFSGNLELSSGGNTTTKVITNGKFNVAISN